MTTIDLSNVADVRGAEALMKAANNPVGLSDESDTPFVLSDDEQLAIALHSSLGPNSCQADDIILAGAPYGTAQGTPEKAQRLKDLVRAKVSNEIDELVMKENAPNEGDDTQPDTISDLLEYLIPCSASVSASSQGAYPWIRIVRTWCETAVL